MKEFQFLTLVVIILLLGLLCFSMSKDITLTLQQHNTYKLIGICFLLLDFILVLIYLYKQ